MNPRVSVIMPLFNKAPYVKMAVESVLAQSFLDWELIVVDDGSTDGSPQVVLDLADDRCHVYSQGNLGVSAARNSGVRLAKGELLAFLDADDWWDADFLKEMVAFADSYSEASLWACNYWYAKRGKTRVAVKQDTGYFDYPESYLRNDAMPVWTGAVLLRKEAFKQAGGFNPKIRMAEDFDLWIRIALIYKMAFLNKPLANYNQDVNQESRAIGTLCLPEHHFVFNTDYLLPKIETNPRLQAIVDRVKITCLRQFYISHKYHQEAAKELKNIDINKYRKMAFAKYLWQPLWFLRFESWLEKIATSMKK